MEKAITWTAGYIVSQRLPDRQRTAECADNFKLGKTSSWGGTLELVGRADSFTGIRLWRFQWLQLRFRCTPSVTKIEQRLWLALVWPALIQASIRIYVNFIFQAWFTTVNRKYEKYPEPLCREGYAGFLSIFIEWNCDKGHFLTACRIQNHTCAEKWLKVPPSLNFKGLEPLKLSMGRKNQKINWPNLYQ